MLSYDHDLVKQKNDKKETLWYGYLVYRFYSDTDFNWATISSNCPKIRLGPSPLENHRLFLKEVMKKYSLQSSEAYTDSNDNITGFP